MTDSRNGGYVPYAAYKPRRSQGSVHQTAPTNEAPRPASRPTSFMGGDFFDNAKNVFGGIVKGAEDMSQELFSNLRDERVTDFASTALFSSPSTSPLPHPPPPPHSSSNIPSPILHISTSPAHTVAVSPPQPAKMSLENGLPSPPASEVDAESDTASQPPESSNGEGTTRSGTSDTASVNGKSPSRPISLLPSSSPGASSSKLPPSPTTTSPSRKLTSFRHVSRSSPLNPNASGHSRTTSTSSLRPNLPTTQNSVASHRHSSLGIPQAPASRMSSLGSSMGSVSPSTSPSSRTIAPIHDPPRRSTSLQVAPVASQPTKDVSHSPAASQRATSPPTSQSSPSRPMSRNEQPSRFQPKELRRNFRDGTHTGRVPEAQDRWDAPLTRVERTKLERRLEKIISLHFPLQQNARPLKERRRTSSFFGSLSASFIVPSMDDLDQALKEAEQRITPWEEDKHVNECWICQTSFHPLTNRKHHCRLCGRIVCALPVSVKMITPPASEKNPDPQPRPLRAVKCSSLFVADGDSKGRRTIEEVGEGVDYGVRRHKSSISGSQHAIPDIDDDRFLKGVRICRACRPVLLRMQHSLELSKAGGQPSDLQKLYDAMIALEKDLEEQLPMFHELLGASSTDDPAPELSLTRKHLMESFAHYDAVSKKIATLSYPGKSSGQSKQKMQPSNHERVQSAILMRARLFLEKNMFPLKKALSAATTSKPSTPPSEAAAANVPPKTEAEKKIYDKLQPLLEQEALLETFVEQAQASRKFEDVKYDIF
ncbi:FYVE-domain-containing protein [Flagelloscypha sp. PMI_526]|nr:FYVE-domain-containing protein [Flagelloscypha sp. PMI_526]